jgi:hypothetical protein
LSLSLFPDAEWDNLYTCGLFGLWLFNCDDAMDENAGSVSLDFAASCRYRQQVLDYTRDCLGLDPIYAGKSIISKVLSWLVPGSSIFSYLGLGSRPESPCPSLPNSVFKEFGERVQRTSSKGLWKSHVHMNCQPLDAHAV